MTILTRNIEQIISSSLRLNFYSSASLDIHLGMDFKVTNLDLSKKIELKYDRLTNEEFANIFSSRRLFPLKVETERFNNF